MTGWYLTRASSGCAAEENDGIMDGETRHIARKLFSEGGWVQKRLFDIGWSDESKCHVCHKEEGTEKHWLCHSREWHGVRRGIPDAFRKWERKARTS